MRRSGAGPERLQSASYQDRVFAVKSRSERTKATVAEAVARPFFAGAVIYMRASEQDAKRIDALAEKLPVTSKNAVAVAALRLGLAALEAKPARLLEVGPLPRRVGRGAKTL